MRLAVAACALLLAGCGPSALEKAEQRYTFLERNGASYRDRCNEADKVASLAADEGNQAAFAKWKREANTMCVLASAPAY